MIPSRILVLLMLVPLGLAMAALADRSLLWPMLAADAFISVHAPDWPTGTLVQRLRSSDHCTE